MKFLSDLDDASRIKILDTAENFTAENVEGALAELAALVTPHPVFSVATLAELIAVLENEYVLEKYIVVTDLITITTNTVLNMTNVNIIISDLPILFSNNATLTFDDSIIYYPQLYIKGKLITSGSGTIHFAHYDDGGGIEVETQQIFVSDGNLAITANHAVATVTYETLFINTAYNPDPTFTGMPGVLQQVSIGSSLLAEATITTKGLLSATDKVKLDSLQSIKVKQGTSYTAVELAEGQIGFLYT